MSRRRPWVCQACGSQAAPRYLTGVNKGVTACRACGSRFRAGRRVWSRSDDAFMRKRYPHEPTPTITRVLRRTVYSVYARADVLGITKSDAYLASPHACRLRRGDNVGARFRFQKGHVPANKGLRRPGWGPGRMKETQFKKGYRQRWMPVGSTRLVDGYVYRKVTDTPNVPWRRNWRPDHVLVWEVAHGPVPTGHVLAFRNRDRRDVHLDNLECITHRELMARNTVHNLPKPLVETIQLLGALTRQLRKRTHEKQDRRSA